MYTHMSKDILTLLRAFLDSWHSELHRSYCRVQVMALFICHLSNIKACVLTLPIGGLTPPMLNMTTLKWAHRKASTTSPLANTRRDFLMVRLHLARMNFQDFDQWEIFLLFFKRFLILGIQICTDLTVVSR